MFETQVLEPLSNELLWVILAGFLVAFLLAFSVGANDVSNSFGTSVGSRVLTVTQACILATFFEVAGATLLGYAVCDTLRKEMYKLELYENSQKELMLGSLASLIGSALWNIVATGLKMPISGTHSIIGATIGFGIVTRGWKDGVKWEKLIKIVASWFGSPFFAGTLASIIYLIISKTIIRERNPLDSGLKSIPLFYGLTVFVNVGSLVIKGPDVFGISKLAWYEGLLIALVASVIAICVVALQVVPRMRRKVTLEVEEAIARENSAKTADTVVTSFTSRKQTGDKRLVGLDNQAFTPDMKPSSTKQTRSEIQLDPSKLPETSKHSDRKPPVAPRMGSLAPKKIEGAPAKPDRDDELVEIDLGIPKEPEFPERRAKFSRDLESGVGGIKLPVNLPSGPRRSGGILKSSEMRPRMIRGERFEVFKLFSSLQILTACFASFAHGTNDVSNAVAPLVPIWNIYSLGREDVDQQTQVWILLFGGIGICTGLWAWGRAVMKTVGEGLTQLTPSIGFSVELGSAVSVLLASKLGLPISTTHCKVGSVVIVGFVNSRFCSQDNLADLTPEEQQALADKGGQDSVDWSMFRNIAITWVVTVPLAAAVSSIIMLGFKYFAYESMGIAS